MTAPPGDDAADRGSASLGGLEVVLFCHSLVSCWNHGNAHFLRGVVRELQARGARVRTLEPADGWSRRNLRDTHGEAPERAFAEAFPELRSETYEPRTLDAEAVVDGAHLVVVHEWTDPGVVAQLARARRRSGAFRLLFHDTHHRAVSDPAAIEALDLGPFDGVLAFGDVVRDHYLERGLAARAWTWHEAADVRTFRPIPEVPRERDLVWIGNWGDDERTEELRTFLLGPIADLGLRADVFGVRYPADAIRAVAGSGARYRGWLANHLAPVAFAAARATVHVPRRPYARTLPGVPTIRVFEALACGIPLLCAPWDDVEGLFSAGHDYLVARDGREMRELLREVLHDEGLAAGLAAHGRRTILERHTCAHRVDALVDVASSLGVTAWGASGSVRDRRPVPADGEVRR